MESGNRVVRVVLWVEYEASMRCAFEWDTHMVNVDRWMSQRGWEFGNDGEMEGQG